MVDLAVFAASEAAEVYSRSDSRLWIMSTMYVNLCTIVIPAGGMGEPVQLCQREGLCGQRDANYIVQNTYDSRLTATTITTESTDRDARDL